MTTTLTQHPHIEVRHSPVHGYGVFATKDIKKGVVLEECHYIKFLRESFGHLARDYRFWWNEDFTHYCIVFGYGSIYNSAPSSSEANAWWICPTPKKDLFVFYTTKDIKKGDEIFTNYSSSLVKRKPREEYMKNIKKR